MDTNEELLKQLDGELTARKDEMGEGAGKDILDDLRGESPSEKATFKLEDGTEITADDKDALIAEMGKRLGSGGEEEKDKGHELVPFPQFGNALPPAPIPSTPDSSEWDDTEWAETLVTKPRKAQVSINEETLGETPVFKAVQEQIKSLQDQVQVGEARSFLRGHPEYPSTDVNANNVMKQLLDGAGMGMTEGNLEQAWTYAQEHKYILPVKEEPKVQTAERPPQETPKALPNLSPEATAPLGTGAAENEMMDKLNKFIDETDDMEKITDVLLKMGAFEEGSLAKLAGTG